MAYAGGYKPGDAVRVIQVLGTSIAGVPDKIIGRNGVVAHVNPRLLAAMEPTEVPVRICVRADERTGKEEDFATYLLYPEYLEKVDYAAENTRK